MDCSRWESEGLLYSSDELSKDEKITYEEHLEICEFCKDELNSYNYLSDRIKESDALLEENIVEVDEKVVREFRKKSVKVFWSLPIVGFFEKVVLPLILIVGTFFIGKNMSQSSPENIVAEVVDSTNLEDSLEKSDSSQLFLEGNSVGTIPVSVTDK
jgi:hypothetical protein